MATISRWGSSASSRAARRPGVRAAPGRSVSTRRAVARRNSHASLGIVVDRARHFRRRRRCDGPSCAGARIEALIARRRLHGLRILVSPEHVALLRDWPAPYWELQPPGVGCNVDSSSRSESGDGPRCRIHRSSRSRSLPPPARARTASPRVGSGHVQRRESEHAPRLGVRRRGWRHARPPFARGSVPGSRPHAEQFSIRMTTVDEFATALRDR
jgi:hypothetical protein